MSSVSVTWEIPDADKLTATTASCSTAIEPRSCPSGVCSLVEDSALRAESIRVSGEYSANAGRLKILEAALSFPASYSRTKSARSCGGIF